jgi:hypothetical protein
MNNRVQLQHQKLPQQQQQQQQQQHPKQFNTALAAMSQTAQLAGAVSAMTLLLPAPELRMWQPHSAFGCVPANDGL